MVAVVPRVVRVSAIHHKTTTRGVVGTTTPIYILLHLPALSNSQINNYRIYNYASCYNFNNSSHFYSRS